METQTNSPPELKLPEKLKILFLDIDGVINSTRTAVASGIGYPHDLDRMDLFDVTALGLIRKVCALGNVSVVLSSTWRLHFGHHEVANALDLPIIGSTANLRKERGHEIHKWLEENKDRVECYAIVDDDSDMLPYQMRHFCQTDCDNGLMWKDYLKLANLLGIEDPLRKTASPARGQ